MYCLEAVKLYQAPSLPREKIRFLLKLNPNYQEHRKELKCSVQIISEEKSFITWRTRKGKGGGARKSRTKRKILFVIILHSSTSYLGVFGSRIAQKSIWQSYIH
jgi:hypothetical protein